MWNASEISHLGSYTGPSAGLASHIFLRIKERQVPNCIALGAGDFSIEAFTNRVVTSVSLH